MTAKVLAFNTSTDLCSVALAIGSDIYFKNVISPKRHSEIILSIIDRLMVDVGFTLKSLDYIIFDKGPGSFVGVRMGIGVAQGLALGAGLPLVAVSSLATLAQGAYRIFSFNKVVAIINACMNSLYWAHYSKAIQGFWTCEQGESFIKEIVAQKLMLVLKGDWAIVGTGWNQYPKLKCIIENIGSTNNILKSIMLPQAQDMIPLGRYDWENNNILKPDEIKPFYLHNRIATSV